MGSPAARNQRDRQILEPRLGRSVSIEQAAPMLNLSRRTIYNRIQDGRVQTLRTPGSSQQVLIESLRHLGFRHQPFSTSATLGVRALSRFNSQF